MHVLAISNYKGGCGKTSSAINLGACLAEKGKRVLLIDLDPQMSATQWMGLQQDSKALYEAFSGEEGLTQAVMPTACKGLEMIPGSRWMLGIDKALASEIGAEFTLQRKLKELPDNWDFVILDCPPATGIISLNALCAADQVLIPLEPTALNTGGLVHMVQTVKQVQDRLNAKLRVLGILPCRVDRRTRLAKEVVDSLRDRFGDQVFKAEIRDSVKMRECASFGQAITQYDPKGGAAEDYRAAANETLQRIAAHEQVANR